MKKKISVIATALLLNASLISLPITAQPTLGESENQFCTYGDCTVVLEQWYSAIFNSAYWELHISCNINGTIVEDSWDGDGVWTGSACGGKIGY